MKVCYSLIHNYTPEKPSTDDSHQVPIELVVAFRCNTVDCFGCRLHISYWVGHVTVCRMGTLPSNLDLVKAD
jgi:hypothetical protein